MHCLKSTYNKRLANLKLNSPETEILVQWLCVKGARTLIVACSRVELLLVAPIGVFIWCEQELGFPERRTGLFSLETPVSPLRCRRARLVRARVRSHCAPEMGPFHSRTKGSFYFKRL